MRTPAIRKKVALDQADGALQLAVRNGRESIFAIEDNHSSSSQHRPTGGHPIRFLQDHWNAEAWARPAALGSRTLSIHDRDLLRIDRVVPGFMGGPG
jgi:hypothetical protein